jgi:hypothetical protein
MHGINKPLLRLAMAIHGELSRHRAPNIAVELPTRTWERCVELLRQSRRAELRGWQLAADQLRREVTYTLPSLRSLLDAMSSRLTRSASESTSAVGDIYSDLLALQTEFGELTYDMRGKWLSTTTEPITLQGIYLGPFSIRLNWGRVGDDTFYRVIANDPHPPESRDNVTHPHVMDEHLCEGDSRHAIRQAAVQGRLLDCFTLVANGLRSYNPESPLVALELWSGSTCSDCGTAVDEDESYSCRKCGETICSGCESTCSGCDDSCCSQCITSCELCDDSYCRSCF